MRLMMKSRSGQGEVEGREKGEEEEEEERRCRKQI